MVQQSFSIGGETTLRLHVRRAGGDLRLIGTDESYLRLQGDGDEADFAPQYQSGDLTMDVREDCTLFVPRALHVTIDGPVGELQALELAGDFSLEAARGDVTLKSLTGRVQLGAVSGDAQIAGAGAVAVGDVQGDLTASDIALSLRVGNIAGDADVRAAQLAELGSVRGDLRADRINGDFTAGTISGDAKLTAVAGRAALGAVGGDARLAGVGNVGALQAGGDLYVDTALDGESEYRFAAGGDVTLALPRGTNAQIECMAGGDTLNQFEGNRKRGGRAASFTLGAGGARVRVQAGGDIKIKPREGEAMEFRFEIHREEMERAKDELKRAKDEMHRVRREIRAQVREQKAGIRRSVREDVEGAMRRSFTFNTPGFPFGGGPRPGAQKPMRDAAAPAKAGASEEERLEILKMLEQKRLTTEQAEMLLAALGDE